jgi:hypothetical protein
LSSANAAARNLGAHRPGHPAAGEVRPSDTRMRDLVGQVHVIDGARERGRTFEAVFQPDRNPAAQRSV